MSTKTYSKDALKLDVSTGSDAITLEFTGKSTAREPGIFLNPVFGEVLKQAKDGGLPITMDFRKLEYMNSSTITPVIRMLHEAKGTGTTKVTVLFDSTLRWQTLSFSALTVFQTPDQRIEIRGA